MLKDVQGKMKSQYVPDYVVFDLETTGTSTSYDQVVEISAIKVKNSTIVDEYSTLVNPDMPIPIMASEVNGIYDDMVKDAPDFRKALGDFNDFVGDLPLVGHNIRKFDMIFVCRDALKYFGKTIGNDYIDTLYIARAYLPGMGSYALSALASHYGIDSSGAHRALNDCRMNQALFESLAKEMENPSEAAKSVKKCPNCGSVLTLRNGKYGEFWGCTGYPDCKYTRNK